MAQNNTALIVSYQTDYSIDLSEALTSSGLTVSTAATMSGALGAVGPGKVDLLVLAPSIPVGDRRRIEGEARRRNQQIRIVLLYSGEAVRDVFANAVLDDHTSPQEITHVCLNLLAQISAENQARS